MLDTIADETVALVSVDEDAVEETTDELDLVVG